MTCPMETYLGPYVLGGLEPGEETDIGRHLEDCAECQDALIEIAWIPWWLQKVPVHELELLITEDETEAAEHAPLSRWRHRWLVLATAAAAAAAVTVGITAELTRGAEPWFAASTVQSADQHTHVAATLTMTPQEGKTELRLALTGVAPGEHCSLIARAKDGRAEVAATWRANYRGAADIPASTTIPAGRLSGFDVVGAEGQVLLRLATPPHR